MGVGDGGEPRALLQMPDVQRAGSAAGGDEDGHAIRSEGERAAGVSLLMRERQHASVDAQIVEDDTAVRVADADDVERGRLLQTQHGRFDKLVQ